MNLRNVENYNIGLDLGTNSVGWAVTDTSGELLHFKGKPTWGSRLFQQANQASTARAPRSQRRRYIRRRWRLNLLQGIFAEEMQNVDSDFFIRLNQARLLEEDRDLEHRNYKWPLFNDSDFTERDYYDQFPTIFHLRLWLMKTEEKADLRLIYLAFHNIVKHRGNFLQEDNTSLCASKANPEFTFDVFCQSLEEWCENKEIDCVCRDNRDQIVSLLQNKAMGRREIKEKICELIDFKSESDSYSVAALNTSKKELVSAIVGLMTDFSKAFLVEGLEGAKFRLSDDEAPDVFAAGCPEEARDLYESLRGLYSSYVLSGILTAASVSESKVQAYERYGEDLRVLKKLVNVYVPDKYDEFFRGEFYEGTREYNPSKAIGYTRYNMGPSKKGSGAKPMSYDDFKKCVKALFAGTDAENDEVFIKMMADFEEERFLRRLRTSDNGCIPFQLNLEELDAIIENQKRFYPFLAQEKNKLDSLVRFRIPYYVGPLSSNDAPVDSKGNRRFSWSTKREGMGDTPIYPWNWEDVIDKHQSAQAFIERMTGTCAYLDGEPVLPRCSLLYEEFCVLNELAGAKWSADGDKYHRFDYRDRAEMFEELFCKRKVSYKQAENWMRQRNIAGVIITGGQGENGFESSMESLIFFTKNIYGGEEIPRADYPMLEEIILWNTLFEDRSILKEKIKEKYGDEFSDEQIKKICKKRFTGWGSLSRKFLTEVKVPTDSGDYSIMDILREGNQNAGQFGRAMVLMEILHDDNLGFEKRIKEINEEARQEGVLTDINDLPGSPALRRPINQALRIVDEIVGIAGKPPANIFIEVTREDDIKKKGQRTTTRYKAVEEALASLEEQGKAALSELKSVDPKALDSERLMLYFLQNGKSLYSGQPLLIEQLSSYQVDHIIPQSYIVDDSIDNKVLVLAEENQRKIDDLLLDPTLQKRMLSYWSRLHEAKLISDKKFKNLTCTSISEGRMKSFISRQLVETSQSVKLTRMMLEERYPQTRVESVKASISSQLRKECEFIKCRSANDYHHAHDAYIACQVGRFIQNRFGDIFENRVRYSKMTRLFIQKEAEAYKKGKAPGQSSFLVKSFLRSGFDKETGEIFDDVWDADFEIGRIRKCLNYKDCFVTKMPEEAGGAFWDATIYSPKGQNKELGLRLKADLDASKYGSYSREQYAYFFVYGAQKGKKGLQFIFEPVPISAASGIASGLVTIEEYGHECAEKAGLEFVRIVRNKVLKQQLIEVDGNRFYITGKKEVRNARQIAFSVDEMRVLKSLEDGQWSTTDERFSLMEGIVKKMNAIAPRLAKLIDVNEVFEKFVDIEEGEQVGILLSLIAITNAQTNMINLSAVGKGANSGCMRVAFSKEMQKQSFAFIDQSVTGMFEKRQTLG